VGKQDAPGACGPLQDLLIRCARKADVLDADDIEIGPAAQQAADNIVVEILIGAERKHL
jgi:hypothetical protein